MLSKTIRSAPGPRQALALHQLEDRRHHQRDDREQQHRGLRRRARAAEDLSVAAEAADEHRGAHHEQDVADDRADDRRLHDLVEAGLEREQRDDQLRRVAERDVQQAADARARSAPPAPPSRGPSAPRSGSRRAPS